jgi:hypothetical protein
MVATPPQTDTYNTALDIFDRTHPLRVDADENLRVTGTFTPSGIQDVAVTNFPAVQNVSVVSNTTGINIFATSDTVPSGIETVVLTYTVPATTFNITQLVGWGTYVGEFLIYRNGTIVGGGRTSTATQTLILPYSGAPIVSANGDTITVSVLQYGPGPRQFRINLLGE